MSSRAFVRCQCQLAINLPPLSVSPISLPQIPNLAHDDVGPFPLSDLVDIATRSAVGTHFGYVDTDYCFFLNLNKTLYSQSHLVVIPVAVFDCFNVELCKIQHRDSYFLQGSSLVYFCRSCG